MVLGSTPGTSYECFECVACGVLKTFFWGSRGPRNFVKCLASLGCPTVGVRKLEKITNTVNHNNRTYKGFHFFRDADTKVFQALLSGEFNISGFKNKTLCQKIPGLTSSQASRLLKRLGVHGLVKKMGHTFKYYLTSLGKEVLVMALKLKHQVVIPQLAGVLADA